MYTFCLSIYPLMDIWVVSTPWLLRIVLLWTLTYKFVYEHFLSLRYIPWSGIAGSYSISSFNILRNYTLFSKVAAPFCIVPAVNKGSIFSASLSTLVTFHFFFIALLLGVKWYFNVVLICISLMTRDIGYLFMCLITIYISSLKKCLLRSFAHCYLGCLFIIEL